MTILATATLTGPEARGSVSLIKTDSGAVMIEIQDYWVASGPDPRLYLSPRIDDQVDKDAIDLGRLPTDVDHLRWEIPADVDLTGIRSIIVYCTLYGVYFGSGVVVPA